MACHDKFTCHEKKFKTFSPNFVDKNILTPFSMMYMFMYPHDVYIFN
jgi:hypothetical protein